VPHRNVSDPRGVMLLLLISIWAVIVVSLLAIWGAAISRAFGTIPIMLLNTFAAVAVLRALQFLIRATAGLAGQHSRVDGGKTSDN